jgi:hypothetical protein
MALSSLFLPRSVLSLPGHGHTAKQRTERTLKLGKIEEAICLLLLDSLAHHSSTMHLFLSPDALPIVPDSSAQVHG